MEMAANSLGPLDGVQVVVTRPEEGDGPLTRHLAERGARVIHWPVVRFEPPVDSLPLDGALERLSSYDGIVFTSPRAVDAVCERVRQPGIRPWVAAIGEATRDALERAGWRVDRVPASALSSELASELADLDCAGLRILFPASSIAREELPRHLRELGAVVDRVTAYRTVPNEGLDTTKCLEALDDATISIVTFASPSAVTGLAARLDSEAFERLLAVCSAVAIGPTTAAALEGVGFRPAVTATTSTLAGLAEAAEQATSLRKES